MEEFQKIIELSNDRVSLWIDFIKKKQLTHIAEVGVYKGEFAKEILKSCVLIEKYFMIDPWKNLNDWNKPANLDNNTFNDYYNETLKNTYFANEKRIILRGKTIDVIDEVEDESLDYIYVDGDHTLKGIAIDLINTWPKLKHNGYLAGDDFCPSIWQHNKKYEPTLVFPFAIYFAEAVKAKIYGLPYNQFLICKDNSGFQFIDYTNNHYEDKSLVKQLIQNKVIKNKEGFLKRLLKKYK